MTTNDWYRNKHWNKRIEEAFFAKLNHARRKEQYLRIQASTLSSTHPEVALKLLSHYFELGDDFDHAQAHLDQAAAYLTLGKVEEAVASYESALAREEEFPKSLTQAYLDFPLLVATKGLTNFYLRSLYILDKFRQRPTFPDERFKWFAAKALILSSQGDIVNAKSYASEALAEADKRQSGFRYHQQVGLVSPKFEDLKSQLQNLRTA